MLIGTTGHPFAENLACVSKTRLNAWPLNTFDEPGCHRCAGTLRRPEGSGILGDSFHPMYKHIMRPATSLLLNVVQGLSISILNSLELMTFLPIKYG